jgi:hypothetical protein
MKYTTYGDLRLGVRDLLENKAETASLAIAFRIYQDPLKARLEALESLHRALRGKPLSEELAGADGIHDSTGRALYYIGKAVEELTDIDENVRVTVIEIVGKVIPSLSLLRESYENEADRAANNRKVLESNAEFAEAFPFGKKHTMKSILAAHVGAGEKLNELLSKRADTVAVETGSRTKELMTVRGVTIGLLNRFRQAVADEVAHNLALPRDLEAKIFSYFDQMEANRAARYGKPENDVEDESETETPTV